MPLIIITGIPSSGKTTRANELKKLFELENKIVHLVSESDALEGNDKNLTFKDPAKEKEIRGILKSQAQRLVTGDNVVIIDSGNYIKGYRYELYCMSKECKTTQCTIHCQMPVETARTWNESRGVGDKYTEEVFDALVMRYESPDSRNRWDHPLITVFPDDPLPTSEIMDSLFSRKAPPPNKSTQCQPISSTNFLYELDQVTQRVISEIMSSHKMGVLGDVKIAECPIPFTRCDVNLSAPQLARLRRQFLAYTKMNPPRENEISSIPALFVQFLNHRLSE